MDDLEILVPIFAILFGSLIVLIPIAGLTARFALRPIMEAVSHFRGTQAADQRIAVLEQRLALLEEQVHSVERDHRRLVEDAEFQRQLDHHRKHAPALRRNALQRLPLLLRQGELFSVATPPVHLPVQFMSALWLDKCCTGTRVDDGSGRARGIQHNQ